MMSYMPIWARPSGDISYWRPLGDVNAAFANSGGRGVNRQWEDTFAAYGKVRFGSDLDASWGGEPDELGRQFRPARRQVQGRGPGLRNGRLHRPGPEAVRLVHGPGQDRLRRRPAVHLGRRQRLHRRPAQPEPAPEGQAQRLPAVRRVEEHRPARLLPAGPVGLDVGHPAVTPRHRGRRHHQSGDRRALHPGPAGHRGVGRLARAVPYRRRLRLLFGQSEPEADARQLVRPFRRVVLPGRHGVGGRVQEGRLRLHPVQPDPEDHHQGDRRVRPGGRDRAPEHGSRRNLRRGAAVPAVLRLPARPAGRPGHGAERHDPGQQGNLERFQQHDRRFADQRLEAGPAAGTAVALHLQRDASLQQVRRRRPPGLQLALAVPDERLGLEPDGAGLCRRLRPAGRLGDLFHQPADQGGDPGGQPAERQDRAGDGPAGFWFLGTQGNFSKGLVAKHSWTVSDRRVSFIVRGPSGSADRLDANGPAGFAPAGFASYNGTGQAAWETQGKSHTS